MASRVCKPCRELLRQQLGLLREFNQAFNYQQTSLVAAARISRRPFHQSTSRGENRTKKASSTLKAGDSLGDLASNFMPAVASKAFGSYVVHGATEKLYKVCSKPASYTISEKLRKQERIPMTKDGEEIGVGGGIWHDKFDLPPTFSTWSQVTMLHMWLLVIRLRCLETNAWQAWQKALVDHFFNDAEAKMGDMHGMTSRMVRSRYLSTLFEVWRGVIMSYDEGLMKSDAVLAAAVWRNLYKSKADVDMRHVAAIVSWIRRVAQTLDQTDDAAFMYGGAQNYLLEPVAVFESASEPSSPAKR